MVTLVVVLGVVTIGVILARELLCTWRELQLARGRRAAIGREALRAEQRLHQLTQDAVAQMLDAARRR